MVYEGQPLCCYQCSQKKECKYRVCDLFLCDECENQRQQQSYQHLDLGDAKAASCNNPQQLVVVLPNTEESSADKVHDADTVHHLAAENLQVLLPPQGSSSVSKNSDCQSTTNSDCQSTTKSTASDVMVNELLCYLTYKMESLTVDHLVHICVGFYSDNEIMNAKRLLFGVVETDQRFISRRGDAKNSENLKDMIKVLLQLNTLMPNFVARDLNKLPPLTAAPSDTIKVARDLEAIKAELSLLRSNQQNLSDIVQCSVSMCRPSSMAPAPVQGGEETVVMTNPTQHSSNCHSDTLDAPNNASDDDSHADSYDDDNVALGEVEDRYDDVQVSSTNTYNHFKTRQFYSNTYKSKLLSARPQLTTGRNTYRRPNQGRPQGYGTKSHQDVIIGKGQIRELAAADQSTVSTNKVSPQRRCVGVFVTRLKPSVTEKLVNLHIKRETSYVIKSEKLKTKFNNYCSFFIPCDGIVRNSILSADIWPLNTLLKPFYVSS